MKIDCGVERPPLTEKDRRNLEKWRAEGNAWVARRAHNTQWHLWYAWFPVRLADNDCRWFEWVERRIEYYGGVVPMEKQRLYRATDALRR
jgi:hypothetical protein